MSLVRALSSALIVGMPAAGIAACDIARGPHSAALVELYTSEGCSSCPPADRRLAELRVGPALVPLALHVGYWDDLGCSDPYARNEFAARQRWLTGRGGRQAVYTPQFFVGGTDVRPADLAAAIDRLNEQPALASIRLQAHTQRGDALAISASARTAVDGAALYVALAENGLSSRVRTGENKGRRLNHGHVVRVWIGQIELNAGAIEWERSIPLAPSWQPAQLELSAFVQDRRSGWVLRSVGAARCADIRGQRA